MYLQGIFPCKLYVLVFTPMKFLKWGVKKTYIVNVPNNFEGGKTVMKLNIVTTISTMLTLFINRTYFHWQTVAIYGLVSFNYNQGIRERYLKKIII